MPTRSTLHIAVIIFLSGLVPPAFGQDLASLQAGFEAELDALNSRNMDGVLSLVDNDVVLFGIFSPFPITGKDGYQRAVQEYFDAHVHAVLATIDPEYRIMGTTGVAWGNFRLATQLKNGPSKYAFGRYMFTYTQANGQWRILSMHYSLLKPLE